MNTAPLMAAPLSAEAFAPYGEVIETRRADPVSINAGTANKYSDLARVELADGRPCLSVYRAKASALPLAVTMLERHPLGSQAFVPLDRGRMLIVVAAAGVEPAASSIRAFVSDGRQGINLVPGTWHHPLVALDRDGEFLVLDRLGPEENCDVTTFSQPIIVDID